jgi:hypothetical protein
MVRSHETPDSAARPSSHAAASPNVSVKVSGSGNAGRHGEHLATGIEQLEERKEVALVRAAAVEEDEQPLRLGRRRPDQVSQGVRGHARGR